MQKLDIRNLYYITHMDNLSSILKWGILSHERIEDERVQPARIYNTYRQQKERKKHAWWKKSMELCESLFSTM